MTVALDKTPDARDKSIERNHTNSPSKPKNENSLSTQVLGTVFETIKFILIPETNNSTFYCETTEKCNTKHTKRNSQNFLSGTILDIFSHRPNLAPKSFLFVTRGIYRWKI